MKGHTHTGQKNTQRLKLYTRTPKKHIISTGVLRERFPLTLCLQNSVTG